MQARNKSASLRALHCIPTLRPNIDFASFLFLAYLQIYVYKCIPSCIYVHIYIHTCIHIRIHVHVHVHVHVHAHVHAHIYIYIYTHVHNLYIHLYIYIIYIYMCTYICFYIYVYIYICIMYFLIHRSKISLHSKAPASLCSDHGPAPVPREIKAPGLGPGGFRISGIGFMRIVLDP